MGKDKVDIEDLEAFINGLKDSFDTLENIDPTQSRGFQAQQAQMAKAISDLRSKKAAKIEPLPKHIGHFTKEDLKEYLLKELGSLQDILDSSDYNRRRKFELVKKIALIREQVNNM
jgi:ABC-type Zn uptake system ZnuABC Zn-binding protein ZnuA